MPVQPELYLVKAFTQTPAGGNAAGVVLYADSLAQHEKQRIAASLGLSETAFVSNSDIGDAKVEFFTPNRQIPHCGHATVATFGLLSQKGLVNGPAAVKESVEGPRNIELKEGKVYQAQLAPRYKALSETSVSVADVAASLGLESGQELLVEPVLAHTGVWFLLVQVRDEGVLRQLEPVQEMLARVSEALDLVGYYVFTTATGAADATTRMFAPRYGIPEESATGMAAGPLACYLRDALQYNKTEFLIHQGYLMQPPSPSQLEVYLTVDANGSIAALKAGGPAVVVEQLALPA
ncbi:PhzF family phenazine biosynthesis protein [Pontibacter actiniarum]|uniref:Phenazine biosynthesis protein PhzF family protein n=1 Tax=Pontibacter actiniarum TaxID=323450 RepID=A0A1X9YR55_9BACT|nr:PhzF family phenazine biosynthesis protein [Pontibacter actiniarum]ARS35365.1 phenazine biosynthesis protein PhzF family protein [Pontibacter actiniarum]